VLFQAQELATALFYDRLTLPAFLFTTSVVKRCLKARKLSVGAWEEIRTCMGKLRRRGCTEILAAPQIFKNWTEFHEDMEELDLSM